MLFYSAVTYLWTGIWLPSDNDTWQTFYGEVFESGGYTNWSPAAEEASYLSTPHEDVCVYLNVSSSHQWFVASCNDTASFICEEDTTVNVPGK